MRELYRQTFSQVHSSAVIRWEDMEAMKPKKKISRNFMMLAAVVALLAGLSTVAVATDLFGLRSLLLPQKQEVTMPVDPETGEQEVQTVDFISLSGYQDLPEGQAAAEWQSFLNGYDVAGAAVTADANPGGMDGKYALYQVYNREMAEKLDEIVEKYDLKLHTALIDACEHPEAMEGIWEALGENRAYSAYMYEDGTFQFDGEYDLPDYGTVDYQFRRAVRGTFHEVVLNVGDISQYKEWIYKAACGQTVTLALSPNKGLVLADLGDSFVTVNVLAGTEKGPDDMFSSGPFSAENLETLADSFDYTVLTPAKPVEGPKDPEEDALYVRTGIEASVAEGYVENLAALLRNADRETVAGLLIYPCIVEAADGKVTVNSPEEFLPYYDKTVNFDAKTLVADLGTEELFSADGLVGAAGGKVWFGLKEDGDIRIFTIQVTDSWSIRHFSSAEMQVAPGETQMDDSGIYMDQQGTSDVYSELELRSQEDSSYMASIRLHRLMALEGVAAYQNGELHFVCADPAVEARLTIDGDTAEAVITKSEVPSIRPGDVFQFLDGKK